MTHFERQIGELLRKQENVTRSKSLLSLYKGLYSVSFLLCFLLLVSCSNGKTSTNKEYAAKDTTTVGKNITGAEDSIEQLLKVYNELDGKEQSSTANKIFALLYREELTDD